MTRLALHSFAHTVSFRLLRHLLADRRAFTQYIFPICVINKCAMVLVTTTTDVGEFPHPPEQNYSLGEGNRRNFFNLISEFDFFHPGNCRLNGILGISRIEFSKNFGKMILGNGCCAELSLASKALRWKKLCH